MTLIQSWIDSLQLLKPKNLQLFAMVTLKSIAEAYKLYFKYFWWLIAGVVVLYVLSPDLYFAEKIQNIDTFVLYAQMLGAAYCLFSLLFLAACFSTRPSLMKKNCSYFRTMYKKIIFCWLGWFVIGTLLVMKRSSFHYLFSLNSHSIWYIFFVCFFADSETSINNIFVSIWNALKMIIFNLPLLIISKVCFNLISAIAYMYIPPFTIQLLATLLLPVSICWYTNIYIKKLYDQFDLYIKQPQ